METGWGKWYRNFFLILMKRKVWLKRKMLRPLVDVEGILASRSFQVFDEALTLPIFGFRDRDAYYAAINSENHIPNIQIPTLILHAMDDPFFSYVPFGIFERNENITSCFPECGGHVGFIEGWGRFWAERQVARFFESVFFVAGHR